jgi:2-methylcitrate dehydratase PrpD
MKSHSCCAAQHVTIEVLLKLMAANGVSNDDVESVQLYSSKQTMDLLRPDLPKSISPKDGAETRFSMHHAHAVALADGETSFRAFSDTAASVKRYEDARRKIHVIPGDGVGEGRVELKLKDGRSFSGGSELLAGEPKGWPTNPFTREELVARHYTLCEDVLSNEQIRRSADLVLSLEDVADVSELMNLVTYADMAVAA